MLVIGPDMNSLQVDTSIRGKRSVRGPLLAVFGLLTMLAGASDAAAADRRACRLACRDEVAACREGGGTRRECRREFERSCRREGIAFCEAPALRIGAAAPWASAPTNVTATVLNSTSIRIAWEHPDSGEDGFVVERYNAQTAGFEVLVPAPGGSVSPFTNTGLAPSTRYDYRVLAFRKQGSNYPTGTESAVVSATTQAPPTTTSTSTSSTTSTSRTTTTVTTSSTSTSTSTSVPGSTSSTTSTSTSSTTTSTTGVNSNPIANAGPNRTVGVNTLVTFDASASYDPNPGDSIVQYTWNFGDGSSLKDGRIVTHTFTVAATRTVTLYVRDTHSAWGTDTAVITVSSGPVSTTTTSTSSSSSTSTSTSSSTTTTAISSTTSTTVASGSTWVRTIGGTSAQSGNASVVDGSGNIYVGGYFMGSMTVGGTTLTSAGDLDGFVAKYNSSGVLQWIRQIGSTTGDTIDGIAVDSGGGVIAVGRFTGTINPGGGALVSSGGSDILVVKYSASGGHTWSRRYGGTYNDVASAVAVDGTGNVYFTGYFAGTIDFGGGPITVPFISDLDVYLTKLSTTGAYVWAKGFSNNGNEIGYGVAASSTGDVVMVGAFNSRVNFGGGNIQANDVEEDGFVAKFSTAGVHQWSKRFGDVMDDTARAVDIDGSGNVAVTGEVRGSVNFGGSTLTGSLVYTDAFVASYSSSGTHRWSRRMGNSTASDAGYGITHDGSNNVIVAGDFRGAVNFGSTLTSAGLSDAFVASYAASNGNFRWVEGWGGGDDDRGLGVGAGASVVGAGSFKSTATIVGTTVTSAGSTDAYLARRNP